MKDVDKFIKILEKNRILGNTTEEEDEVLRSFGVAGNRLQSPIPEKPEDIIKDKEYFYYGFSEVIVGKKGEVYKLTPSHVYTLMYLAGYRTQEEAYDEIPVWEDVVLYLVEKSGCIAVWKDFCYEPSKITKEQRETIDFLFKEKIVTFKLKG